MILATRYSGDVSVRSFPQSMSNPPGRSFSSSSSGRPVSVESALGLPAFGRAVRLVAGIVGSLSLGVFEGRKGDRRERSDVWVARLLANPCAGMSTFDFWYDVAASLEASENAFLQKIRGGGRVLQLQPIPLGAIHGRIDGESGLKVFDVDTTRGRITLTTADVLHIRGHTVNGGPFGVSRIHQHCDPIGSMEAAQTFEGSYFRNHARPDIAMVFPQGVSREQGNEWADNWNAKMSGPENAGKAIAVGAGVTIQPIELSMRDAQFIESRNLGVQDAGRIMDIDAVLLGAESAIDARESALNLLLKVQLPPRLVRIAHGIRADLDLFAADDVTYPAFEVDALMFADPLTRAQTEHQRIQDGSSLVDEVRAGRGEPPLPPLPADWTQEPGKIPQVTPVGGAINPTVDTGDPMPEPRARELVIVNLPADDSSSRELRDGLRELTAVTAARQPVNVDVHVPELAAPVIHVDAPVVNMRAAETLPAVVNMTVQPAEVRAGDIIVQPSPVQVDVHVPEGPAPTVNIENHIDVPARKVTVERDPQGRIRGMEVEDA